MTYAPRGDSEAATLTGSLYERLKQDILAVRLAPGQKLQMRFLIESYDAGQTPLREALNRLASEDLVVGKAQRGFSVKPIHRAELAELTKTRCWVETVALRESMAHATDAWEETLVLAHHRLSRSPRSLDPEVFRSNPDWEKAHRAFHHQLIANCGSASLVTFCEQLADRLFRYRMLSIQKAFRTRAVGDEHARILDHVLKRETEVAIDLLTSHYEKTAAFIIDDFDE